VQLKPTAARAGFRTVQFIDFFASQPKFVAVALVPFGVMREETKFRLVLPWAKAQDI